MPPLPTLQTRKLEEADEAPPRGRLKIRYAPVGTDMGRLKFLWTVQSKLATLRIDKFARCESGCRLTNGSSPLNSRHGLCDFTMKLSLLTLFLLHHPLATCDVWSPNPVPKCSQTAQLGDGLYENYGKLNHHWRHRNAQWRLQERASNIGVLLFAACLGTSHIAQCLARSRGTVMHNS